VKNANPGWSGIPIVILSADAQVAQRAESCGAVGYLRKPVKLETLHATVSRFLSPAGV
jgi:two-component system, chemotaxis family, chemotaxis protein CheY